MTNSGLLHHCLGVEAWQTDNHIFVSQAKMTKFCYTSLRWQIVKSYPHLWRKDRKLQPTLIQRQSMNLSTGNW